MLTGKLEKQERREGKRKGGRGREGTRGVVVVGRMVISWQNLCDTEVVVNRKER